MSVVQYLQHQKPSLDEFARFKVARTPALNRTHASSSNDASTCNVTVQQQP
jgi:hypothetical protein